MEYEQAEDLKLALITLGVDPAAVTMVRLPDNTFQLQLTVYTTQLVVIELGGVTSCAPEERLSA